MSHGLNLSSQAGVFWASCSDSAIGTWGTSSAGTGLPNLIKFALGIDPRPLVVAVMFAASAAFSTPIGYQTNMLVYGPGGYRFADYLKVGIPLNLTLALTASLVIPFFWPL